MGERIKPSPETLEPKSLCNILTLAFAGLKLRGLTFNRRNPSQSSQAIHTMTCGALT
jgi:hypothetical protein